MTDKKNNETKHVIHPVAAAAMGAVVGAAGGIAAARYLSDPDNQKVVGEKINQLKDEAKKRWQDVNNSSDGKSLKDKATDLMEETKKTVKTSGKQLD